jgi:hypothetical protein
MRWLALFVFAAVASAQGSYTAASSAEADVNAVINGPTHTAVNGDVIQIPCGSGSVVWTSQLAVGASITITAQGGTPNTGTSTFGAGTNCLTIRDNYNGYLFLFSPTYASSNNVTTLQNINIDPYTASTTLTTPVAFSGTCTSSGCPLVRVDNVIFGNAVQWTEGGTGTQADWMIQADNVFGVFDHNTLPNGSQVDFLSGGLDAYLGVGAYGDNSWAQPDTFGTESALYMENNLVYTDQEVTDCEKSPASTSWSGAPGGCRLVGRFNQVNAETGWFEAFGLHGLDTGGRARGGRQIEAYGNTLNCGTSSGCAGGVTGYRAGTGFTFGNTMTQSGGGFWNNISTITVYRTVYADSPWGGCGGLNSLDPWDTNDNTVYYSGTVTSASGLTMTDSTKSWTTNQLVPEGAPYSVYDVTQGAGFIAEIASNTATTITVQTPISESSWTGFNNGDSYQIIRSTVCADQAGRGAGNYISGSSPSPSSALNQALDPIYEWDDTASSVNYGNMSPDTGKTIANRDYYTDNSDGTPHAQTSATSPFNGTSGVGFGTLARRPTTCTTGVGYFATDQGTWNTSGNGFGSGVLYVCSSTNTWSSYYTPYAYPHPLVSGGGSSTTSQIQGVTLTRVTKQ